MSNHCLSIPALRFIRSKGATLLPLKELFIHQCISIKVALNLGGVVKQTNEQTNKSIKSGNIFGSANIMFSPG